MEKSVIIAGSGGQGILYAGKVLAYAAMSEEQNTTWLPSYGAEMRGGSANCSIKISDEEIGSPIVEKADMAIILNQETEAKFASKVKTNGLILINSPESKKTEQKNGINYIYAPLSKIVKSIEDNSFINIVAIGILVKYTKLFKLDTIKNSIINSISSTKKYLLDKNLEALELGFSYMP